MCAVSGCLGEERPIVTTMIAANGVFQACNRRDWDLSILAQISVGSTKIRIGSCGGSVEVVYGPW